MHYISKKQEFFNLYIYNSKKEEKKFFRNTKFKSSFFTNTHTQSFSLPAMMSSNCERERRRTKMALGSFLIWCPFGGIGNISPGRGTFRWLRRNEMGKKKENAM